MEGERRRPAARRASFRVRVPPRLVELRRRIRRRRRPRNANVAKGSMAGSAAAGIWGSSVGEAKL